MIVRVEADGSPSLDEPANCGGLHVAGAGERDVIAALESAGVATRLDDDHVALSIAWLRAASAGAATPSAFDGMIRYATTKGWVDDAGTAVRAHVQR